MCEKFLLCILNVFKSVCVRQLRFLKKKTYSQRSVELYNADRHFSINRATFDLPINRRSIIRRIRRYNIIIADCMTFENITVRVYT